MCEELVPKDFVSVLDHTLPAKPTSSSMENHCSLPASVSFSLLIMACEGFPGEILGRKFKMKKQFFLNRNDVIGCGVVGTDLYVKV